MKPELTTLRKFREILAYMNLPVFSYIDNDDVAIIKIHEMGLKMPYLTPTFRPDYYTLTIIKEGKGKFVVGDDVFELGPNCIFIKHPDVYFSSGWTESPVGYSIAFSRKFLLKYFPDGVDEIPVKSNHNALRYNLSESDFEQYEQICLEMFDEAISNSSYKYEMIGNLLNNILLLIEDQKNKIKLEEEDEKNNPIVMAFFKNVDQNFNQLISGESAIVFRTKEHAKMLNLTETYLSKVISKSSGKTINQWINARLICEITYLLKNTDIPINEIAEMFAFNDPKYFYTFFKKNSNATPSSVRNEFNASDRDRLHVYRGDVVNIRRSW